jgi:hypothetical protein
MTNNATVRALRPTHLVGLRALDARTSCVELTGASWPRVLDGDSRLPFWSLLSHSMAHPAGYRRVWVHKGDNGIDGLLVARVRCGGLVWDVRHLWADGDQEAVARDLLSWVCEEAVARAARRVFLETEPSEFARAVARGAGFEQYTWATLYLCPSAGPSAGADGQSARPRARSDEHMLFQLYNAAVPAPVRAAEAMTLDEWVALHKGTRRWTPGPLSGRQQFVWEARDLALAWLEMAAAGKSVHAECLVHPAHESLNDEVVAYALGQASKQPLYATCREYQQPLAAALERAGFAEAGRRAVFVRQLAIRIPEPRLVAARARPTLGG